ncbi:B-cell CLL/lymphoma 9 protein-like [Asterias rubens]|uniref:B-cell CLL/lymphoma 9 protein-like n=1 Tax=Asterias rubens TaxID=7604 RepID=UPI0014552674|nr:B-cell CLL/lymphoma 9 protein-like [Asterias rubens]
MPRKKPHTESEDVLQIRCMWETVSVFQFVGLFRSKFQFTQFDLEDFEYSLAQEESILVADIFARLLRFSLQRTDIQIFNWEGYIQRFVQDRAPRSKDFLIKFPYRGLNPSDRLLLLKQVVDTVYACHAEDLSDYLDDYYSPNDMRFLSIGQDAVNNQYWYFNDLRLYKDQVTPKKGKSAWQCICSCLEEWQAFLKTISKSEHPDEISLYHYLHDEVIPLIQGALEDKKLKAKQRRKRLKQAAKEGKEADVLREYSLPQIDYQEVLRKEREDIVKMSDELTKLAQLANSADLQVTTQTLHSPSLPTIKEEGMIRKRLEDNGLQGDNDLAAKMCMKADKTRTRNKMMKEPDEDDSVFLPDHAGNGAETTKDEKVPPRSKRKGEAKVKEMDWCTNDADNMKMNKVNGDKNQISDGAGMSPHVMQYQQPSHFPMAGSQQVFVFSTRMANQAAQAIYTGQADSILSYHRSQAAHRDYLHPEQDTLPDVMHPHNNMSTQNPQLSTLNQVQPIMMDHNNSNPMQGMLMNQQVEHQSIPHHQIQPMETLNNEHANVKTSGGRKRPDRPNSINTDSNNPSKNPTASHKNVTSDGSTGKQSDSNATTTTVTTKSSKSKSSKRKRPPSSSQQLQPNMTQGPQLSNMPPASNFGAFPQQPFGPGQFPPHPQQMPGIANMGMRPPLQGTPPQSGPLFQMEATETENLDPSALWENPPCNKKTPNLANLAWQQEQQMRMMQQQQGSGSQLPMMQHEQSSMMSPCHETMMTNRPYSEGSQSQEHPEMPPFSPASGPGMPFEMTNYKPPQQIDNPTPEQLRHREERLRTLKEMQRLLFPEEHQTRSPTPGRMVSPSGGMGSPPGNMMTPGPAMMRPQGPTGMMGPQHRPIMHLPNMGPHPNMDNPDPAMGLSPEHRMAQEQIIMPPPPDWDNMTPPQKEWYKLQHEFYALKRRKIATEQMKIGHGPIPELHGSGYRDPIDMGPYHHGMQSGPGIGIGMGPGPGVGPGIPHGLPGDPGLPPTINRCMPGADMDVSNQGPVGPGMTGSGMPGMPGQGMPMPDMPGGQTGQGMPPPPPYHGTHNAATPAMPRRSSLSGPGSLAMNQSTPFPMSPHHVPPGQPSPRSNRTNSLPASGSVPPTTTSQLSTGQVPTGNELKPSVIASGKVTTVITSGSMPTGPVQTSGSSTTTGSVTIGSQQTPSTQAGPVSRQPMSPQQGSPFRPNHQPPTPTSVPTPNPPVGDSTKASKARTPGSNIDQSPRPPQSGTPAGDVQSVVRISQAGGSQPGTPNSAPNNGSRQSVSTPSSLTPPTAKSNSESSNSKPSDGPNAQIPPTQKPSESVGSVTNTSAPQQRLVNFPPSQLNRDKAPNFPPRGEDLQQYASTFYQKASKESSKSSGRLQHFGPGSPVGPEMMGQTGENINSQSTMLRSQPDNSQPQIMPPQQRMLTAQNSGVSQPESMTTQTGVMPLQPGMMTSQSAMMTSQPGMKTSQSAMMTSQPGMMTSQSAMMTSQSGMMTSQPGMMTSQSSMMTSQPGMMTHPRISTSQEMSSHPCMMSPQSGASVADKGSSHLGMISHPGMIRPQHPEMMTPHGMMTSQQEMMASHPSGMSGMMSPQPNIMAPHDAMHHPPGMMQTRMPTSQQMMSQANMGPRQGLMMSQARMGPPHGNPCMPPEEMMLSHGNMTSQPGMMMSHGGMVTSQAGMMSQQRMMSSQPTMMQQQGMNAQTRMASRSPIIESHGMGFDPHHPMDGPMGFHPMHGNMLNNTGMQDMRGMHSMPNRFPGPKQMQRNLGGAPPTMGHSVGPMGRTSGIAPGGSPIMHIDGNPRDSNLMQSESKPISQSQVGRSIHTSSPSPLSLLQSRFSPPLLPDGKGPKQTLQYFPQGNPTPAPQAQSGNPHLNPSNAPGPPGQGPAPKQIQMPFPLEMVTGNPPSMTPSFGPSQRMPGPSARMCGPESMYPQGYPASNRPRQQLPGYVATPRHSMQYSGPPMGMPMSNTMGQQMPYPPGYGPHGLPGSNMAMGESIMHGYNNMPK